MAELADAPDLGSGVIDVGVQVPLAAPKQYNPNYLLISSNWFGFTFYLDNKKERLMSNNMPLFTFLHTMALLLLYDKPLLVKSNFEVEQSFAIPF